MKTIPLRDFQREGAKAFGVTPSIEPWLLAGREQEFVLLPVTPENRSAVMDLAEGLAAVMALRQDQVRSVEVGLNQLGIEAIDEEIRDARKALRRRKQSA
jgi:hypothetical protein